MRLTSIGPKVATLRLGLTSIAGAPSRQAGRALHTGSKAWRIQRVRVLVRDRYTCQVCGQFGNHVDHKHGNADEIVGDEQLQTLCQQCHSAKTAKENHGFGNG